MWDAPFRQQLLDGLVELGYAVEHAFDGTPQVNFRSLRGKEGKSKVAAPRWLLLLLPACALLRHPWLLWLLLLLLRLLRPQQRCNSYHRLYHTAGT
jgi:hypothetical protein